MVERKAWAFVLDGHIFYVLGYHDDHTILCDLRTGQWCRWRTADMPYWNMHRGIMWRGRVVAADATGPQVWQLDADAPRDEGRHIIRRTVSGFQPLRGRESVRLGQLLLAADAGTPDMDDATVTVRYSDDEGATWSRPHIVVLRAQDHTQELRFRSLGRVQAPGRLWEVTDVGGLVRIEGLHAVVGAEQ